MTRKKLLSLLLVDMNSRMDGDMETTTTEEKKKEKKRERRQTTAAASSLSPSSLSSSSSSSSWGTVPANGSLVDKVEAFNLWFAAQGPRVNKLIAATVPRMRIGTYIFSLNYVLLNIVFLYMY